jgi:GT2 family glycosyltransferase
MELSIIIVNWNSADLLRKCLASVLSTAINCEFEILVIDNASYDGSDKMVAEQFPSVRFFQSDQNLGFAAGNNLAFQRCTGRLVLFLNPDTEVVGDAIEIMRRTFSTQPDAGVVGPKLVNADLSVQIDCMRAFPTIINQMTDASLTRKIFGRFDFAGVKPVLAGSNGPIRVEMLPGTCIMLKREIFDQAGRFNERYFMYAEDVELNYRVQAAGWANYYVSSAAVIHHGGQSSNQKSESFFSTIMMREAVWQFLRTTHGAWYASAFRFTTSLAALARLTVLCLGRMVPAGRQFRSTAARSTRKWMKVLRWSLGLEPWAREYQPAPMQPRPVPAA